MQAILPAFTKIAGLVGSTSAATGTSLLGTVVSGISGLAQASYQAKVAANNAAVMEEEARNTRMAGQLEAQERDFAAAAEMAQYEQMFGASGFELGSSAFNRRRSKNTVLARRDALRVRAAAERGAISLENEAQAERASARAAKMSGLFGLVETGLNFGSTLINDATLVRRSTASSINRTSRTIY